MKRKVSIIIVVSSFEIEFDVFFIDGESLLLFSCFCLIIGRPSFNPTNDILKVASKRRC